MKVIIAGGRDFTDYSLLKTHMDILHSTTPVSLVLCGLARGADTFGERWAKEQGVDVHYYPAEWETYGRSAGYRRNAEMATDGDCLVAFWDGSSKGTGHMITLAEKKGLTIMKIPYGEANASN